MPTEIKEADWKSLRRLHRIALERFCEGVLKEVRLAASADQDGYHDAYPMRLIETAYTDMKRRMKVKWFVQAFDKCWILPDERGAV